MAQTDLERLVFSMEANVTKLVKNMDQGEAKVKSSTTAMVHHVEEAESRMVALFGEMNVGEALEKTFRRARFGVLEEGGAKIGVFGNALEALGPAGLVAAGGLFAFSEAMERAKQAGEWAEGVEQSAGRLGISLEKMQQLDFAGAAIGLKPEELREQLDGVNDMLGKMQAGEPKAKMLMQELGFTPAQVQSFKSVADFLPALAEHLEEAGSAAEQANIAKRGGFERLKPLLEGGGEALSRLTDEAKKAGIVMDNSTVEAAARLNGKMNEMQAIMAGELRKAFIDLMPIAVQLSGIMAGLAAEFADGIMQMERLAGIRLPGDVKGQRADLEARIKALQNPSVGGFLTSRSDSLDMLTAGGRQAKLATLQSQLHALNVQDVLDQLGDQMKEGGGKPRLLLDPKVKKPKKGPSDQTDDFDKSARDAADSAAKALSAAQGALTKNIQAHADAEKRAVDQEADKTLTDLAAQEKKIRASKNDAHKADQLALLATARADTQLAATAKKDLIDRQAEEATEKAYEEHQAAINQTMSAIADIMASMASTLAKRNAIERANLLANQFRERQSFDEKTRVDRLDGAYDGPAGQQAYERRMEERTQMINLQGAQRQQQAYQQAGPGAQYTRQLDGDLDQGGEKLAVGALQHMNDGLAQAMMNWRNMGATAKQVLQEITQDLLKMAIERSVTQPLANALFGSGQPGATGGLFQAATSGAGSWLSSLWGGAHAGGGTIPTGKIGLTGEKGPELTVGGAGGTTVIPHDLTAGLLAGMSGAGKPSVGQQNLTVEEHYHLEGTVSERDVMGMIARGRADTLNQAAGMFKNGFGAQLASFSALQN